jgi:probable rRNA maturation factor
MCSIDAGRLREAVLRVLQGEGIQHATVSLAVVDDATMLPLNRRYLHHDYATDVLSFLLEREETALEGEVIISAETAIRQAPQFGWAADQELLLYAVHGTLHLVGYDDQADNQRPAMREREAAYLAQLGVRRPPGFQRVQGESGP